MFLTFITRISFCENIRFRFWSLFDTQLLNFICKYCLLFILDFKYKNFKNEASFSEVTTSRRCEDVFFFFSRRPRPGPGSAMVSVMAERHHRYLTEPECKGSVEQRLKEGTPVRQNRPGIEPGPPETFPARTGHLSSRVC